MSFVYKADPLRGRVWAQVFASEAPELAFHQWPETGDPARVRFLAAWEPPADVRGLFPNLEVLFSSGAGVDQFKLDELPADLPLVRMVEPGIIAGMVEYVSWAVLDLHRDMPVYRRQQAAGRWQPRPLMPATQRRVGVLGLGALGQAVLQRLGAYGFDLAGWSRSRHALPGLKCFAGQEELPALLARSDILICLLPLTPATQGMLNAELFAQLPMGASLVHMGRGPQLVAADLLAALGSGHLAHAIMDVSEPEPLPPGHAFWQHPAITLTPHIASMTQPESAARVVLANLRRHAAGQPLLGLVDRSLGY
jgi:glyoxylate/hydroxypyruvate reductase A